jgi:hypothetical protein
VLGVERETGAMSGFLVFLSRRCETTLIWSWPPPWPAILWAIKEADILKTKNGVFWDVMPCGSCKKRRFGGT